MSDMIKCIAIDDETAALEVIEKFCERRGGIELSVFTDALLGMAAVEAISPQIVFLDIEMENISGLEVASHLPAGICVIFTTAYLQYAHEGFNLDAVDYLHKPFAYSRFVTAIDKALRRIGETLPAQPVKNLLVKQDYSNVTIPLSEIIYIEAMEGYSKIFREGGGCVVSRVILKNIHGMLPQNDFLRIHRSFIVPVARISSFNRQEIRLTNGLTLPVGRQYAADIINRLS